MCGSGNGTLVQFHESELLPALEGSLINVVGTVGLPGGGGDQNTIIVSQTVVATDQVDQVAFQTNFSLCVGRLERCEHQCLRAARTGASGRRAPAGACPVGRPFGSRDAMRSAMCSASLPTPPTRDEATVERKNSPTKYRPGSDPTMPRSCTGTPSSAKTGRAIQAKSGTNPVHQITFATSRSRPSSSIGRPLCAPVVLGTRSIAAAVMSFGLTRASGRPRECNLCRAIRPIGVFTVSTCENINQITGVSSRSHLLPGRVGS